MRPPPRLAVWLMERSLAPAERESVIGDLVEGFAARADANPRGAAFWAWGQTLRSLVPNLRRRRAYRHPHFHTGPATGVGLMNGFRMDVKVAIRMLQRQPLMTVAGWLSLTAGLGLNILLFTLANAILLRPLPLRAPDQLFVMLTERPSGLNHNFSHPDYGSLAEEASRQGEWPVDALVAYSPVQAAITGVQGSEPVRGEVVSGNFFQALGLPIARGRPLTVGDNATGAPPVVVVSARLWRERFDAGSVSGETIALNGTPYSVVGVTAGTFQGMEVGRRADFWAPLAHSPHLTGRNALTVANASWLTLMGRLAPGASREAARDALDAHLRGLFAARGRNPEPVVLQGGARGDSALPLRLRSPVLLLLVAGSLVLLVACLNVANLQLARLDARRHEFAIRAALGASRTRLGRLMLLDGVLLAIAAAVAGLGLAWLTKDYAASMIALFGRPVSLATPLDATVAVASVGLTAFSAVLVAVLSAWQISRRDPRADLADGRTTTSHSRFTQRGLVIVQFALSMALVTGAALLVRTIDNLRETDLGFEAHRVGVVEVAPVDASVTPAALDRYLAEALTAARSTAGVVQAAVAHVMPLDFGGSRMTLDVEGYVPAPDEDMELNFVRISPSYFETIGLPVLRGRAFDRRDDRAAPRRIVVNETMARRYWPGGDAVGRRVRMASADPYDVEVVGVVADAHYRMVREDPRPSFYVPLAQMPGRSAVIHVRFAGDPQTQLAEVRRAITGVSSAFVISRTSTLREQVDRNIASERLAGAIGVVLAAVALLLAAVGLYATMAFVVGRRSREMAVRVALGATTGEVARLVVRESLALVGLGISAGLLLAVWAGQSLRAQLYGVTVTDVASFVAAALALGAVALLASWMPARRAARVDPIVALRD